MKRLLALALVSLMMLTLVGCSGVKVGAPDGEDVKRIEITHYPVTDEGESVKVDVTDAEQIAHICSNLATLKLEKMGYNKPTVMEYSLTFYGKTGTEIFYLGITAHGWLDCNGAFHTVKEGAFDKKFIDSLLDNMNG